MATYLYDLDTAEISIQRVDNGFIIKMNYKILVARTLKEALKIIAKEAKKK